MLKEDLDHIGAEDLHQLQRAWELQHRVVDRGGGAEAHAVPAGNPLAGLLLPRRSPKLDDADWHVFTASRYDAKSGEWQLSRLPVHHIIA